MCNVYVYYIYSCMFYGRRLVVNRAHSTYLGSALIRLGPLKKNNNEIKK